MATGSPPTLVDHQRHDLSPRRRRRWFLPAVAAAVALLYVAAAPAAEAQEEPALEPGLTCDSASPAPGDTLVCGAGGLEAEEPFDWTAAFATDGPEPEELSGDGTVDGSGEAHFDVVVPADADGNFTIEVLSDGEMDPDADYTFDGAVEAPEDEMDNTTTTEPDTTTTEPDETTTTTEAGDTTTTTEVDELATADGGLDDSSDVAVAGVEATPQVAQVPTGGVATGIGPPQDSGLPGSAVALVLVTVTGLLVLVWRRHRRAGPHSA